VGAAGGGIGRDSASSAQLICVAGVGLNGGLTRGRGNEMARSGVHWDWHRCTGRDRGVASKLGVLMGDNSIISNRAGVWDMGGVKMMHFWAVWGKLGGWGCSGSSSDVACRC
jgi:hypothetical protein